MLRFINKQFYEITSSSPKMFHLRYMFIISPSQVLESSSSNPTAYLIILRTNLCLVVDFLEIFYYYICLIKYNRSDLENIFLKVREF